LVRTGRCTLAQREKQHTMRPYQHAAFSWSKACEQVVFESAELAMVICI